MINLQAIDVRSIEKRLPNNVLDWLKANGPTVCVAGGFIRSVVSGEPVSDIDVFISGTSALDVAIATLTQHNRNKSRHIVTKNAVTIFSRVPIQIVTRWRFANAEQVIRSFDFTIASAAFWWDGNKFVGEAHDRFYSDLSAKRLRYLSPERCEDAGGSMLRILKFYQRGYRIPLDSLGRVVARLVNGVDFSKRREWDESYLAIVITGLLFEVDPHATPDEFILETETPVDEA